MSFMKKSFVAAVLVLSSFQVVNAPSSHALIGIAFQSRPVKVVGAIGAVSGGFMALNGYVAAVTATTWSVALAGAALTGYGAIIGSIGLVILDENKVADIEFKAIPLDRAEMNLGMSRREIEIYNQELAQLNGVRQTILAECNDQADTQDAELLWKSYSSYLSPETVKVAQITAASFLQAIR